jgi:2-oxoglutarate dehydrogenase complex dehydrogenase (E1) component-like enzyme
MRNVIALTAVLVAIAAYMLIAQPQVDGPATEVAVDDNAAVTVAEPDATDPPVENTVDGSPEVAVSEADRLFAEKQAAYDKLEKARRDLDRRLARMKMSLWNMELPKEEAEAMTEQLMSAARLLQRPKLMGAFHSLEEIRQELTRVEYAMEQVRALRMRVEAMKQTAG